MEFWRKAGLLMLVLMFLCSASVAGAATLTLDDNSADNGNAGAIDDDSAPDYAIRAYYYGTPQPQIEIKLRAQGAGYGSLSTVVISSDLPGAVIPPNSFTGPNFDGTISLTIPGNDIPDILHIAAEDSSSPPNFALVSLDITPVRVILPAPTLSSGGDTLEFVQSVANSTGLTAIVSADLNPEVAGVSILPISNPRLYRRNSDNTLTLISTPAGDLWDAANPVGVNYSSVNSTAAGTTLMFSAPSPGPRVEKAATPFVVSADVQINDNDGITNIRPRPAAERNFNWPFNVAVLGGTISLNPKIVDFVRGVAVFGSQIDVTRSPESMVATVAQGNPTNSNSQAVAWNGLVLSADVPGDIIITGTPENALPPQGFRIFLKNSVTSSLVVASDDFIVRVTAPGGFYLDRETVNVPYNANVDETVNVVTSLTLTDLTLTRSNVERPSFDWNGLRIAVDTTDTTHKRIAITGTPPFTAGTEIFTVKGTSDKGEVRSAQLTINIAPPPAEPTYSLRLSPAALHPIAEKEFERVAEVGVVATNTTKTLTLASVTIDGQSAVPWNGLTLLVDGSKNISVFGTPTEEESKSFTIRATATTGETITNAILTITVHPAEVESRPRGKFIDVVEEVQVEQGKSTQIELPCLTYITIDSVTEVNPDGKWEWIQGHTPTAVMEFSVPVHPTVTGLYTLRISYSLEGTGYYQNVNYRSVRTDEKDLASSGCALGPGAMVGVALTALGLGLRRKDKNRNS